MNTWFEIALTGISETYARNAATEAFREIDRLEGLLSRFREGSDIDILNKCGSLNPVKVTEECWNCLIQAMDLEMLTEGAFSIAFESFMDRGARIEHGRMGNWLEMDDATRMVYFKYPELCIDLGGIGKGYALDLVLDLLDDWDIDSVLLHSGTSSVVARGGCDDLGGWPVSVGADDFPSEIRLCDGSLSGSSLAVRETHILDLKKLDVLETQRRAWAWAPTGSLSDGLSTSFMLMPLKAIETLCGKHPTLGALIIDPEAEPSLNVFGVATNYLNSP